MSYILRKKNSRLSWFFLIFPLSSQTPPLHTTWFKILAPTPVCSSLFRWKMFVHSFQVKTTLLQPESSTSSFEEVLYTVPKLTLFKQDKKENSKNLCFCPSILTGSERGKLKKNTQNSYHDLLYLCGFVWKTHTGEHSYAPQTWALNSRKIIVFLQREYLCVVATP